VTPEPRHRRRRKLRRTGRHTTPSQVEKVAQQAGRAAPTVAVVGALAVGPQVNEIVSASPAPAATQVVQAHLDAAVLQAHRMPHFYTVRPGDTLSSIAQRLFGHAGEWRRLYHANRSKVSDPNLIFPGEVLRVPHDPPGHGQHTDGNGHRHYRPRHSKGSHTHHDKTRHHHYHGLHGTLGCTGLEHLWESAGGAHRAAVTAASIAMAESSGRQFATGPYGERGYWQINPIHGALSTYRPWGNARAAVILSHNGTNWSPWTTYVDGAYAGRC
jgi:LysM repeat protein